MTLSFVLWTQKQLRAVVQWYKRGSHCRAHLWMRLYWLYGLINEQTAFTINRFRTNLTLKWWTKLSALWQTHCQQPSTLQRASLPSLWTGTREHSHTPFCWYLTCHIQSLSGLTCWLGSVSRWTQCITCGGPSQPDPKTNSSSPWSRQTQKVSRSFVLQIVQSIFLLFPIWS